MALRSEVHGAGGVVGLSLGVASGVGGTVISKISGALSDALSGIGGGGSASGEYSGGSVMLSETWNSASPRGFQYASHVLS